MGAGGSWVPLAMKVAGSAMSGTGSGLESGGDIMSGQQARIAGAQKQIESEFEAQQLEQQAGLTVASSQRAAIEQRRQTDLVQSRALAVAAASGGGASDPTIVNLIGKTAGEGAYRASTALYEGEAQARVMRMQAAAKRFEGANAAAIGEAQGSGFDLKAQAASAKGTATMLSDMSSMYAKYGMKSSNPSLGSGVAAFSNPAAEDV